MHQSTKFQHSRDSGSARLSYGDWSIWLSPFLKVGCGMWRHYSQGYIMWSKPKLYQTWVQQMACVICNSW